MEKEKGNKEKKKYDWRNVNRLSSLALDTVGSI